MYSILQITALFHIVFLLAQEEFMETRPVKQEVVTQAGMCFFNTYKTGHDTCYNNNYYYDYIVA